MKTRKIPMRMCVGCQEMFEKRSLIRLVRTPEGDILFDSTGKKSGRGVYLCKKQACLSAATKGKRIQKAFQCEVPASIFQRLSEELHLISELQVPEETDKMEESHNL